MSVVRLEVLRGLRAQIEALVPELDGNICLGQQDPGDTQNYPKLTIIPVRWRFESFLGHAQKVKEIGTAVDSTVVYNVGYHHSMVQWRLGARNFAEMTTLEQKLIDVLNGDESRPCLLLTTVTACTQLGDFLASWDLEEDQWDHNSAFDQQYYSVIVVDATIPALTVRTDQYTINQLKLGIIHEFDAGITEPTFDTDDRVEVVQINQDGTLSAAA